MISELIGFFAVMKHICKYIIYTEISGGTDPNPRMRRDKLRSSQTSTRQSTQRNLWMAKVGRQHERLFYALFKKSWSEQTGESNTNTDTVIIGKSIISSQKQAEVRALKDIN